MIYDEIGAVVPAIPGIDAIFTMLKSNLGIGLLAVLIGLLVFVTVFKLSDIMNFFKERSEKKHDLELKKLEDSKQQLDRQFSLYEGVTKGVEKIGDTMDKIVETIYNSETRVAEKVTGAETRIIEKISNMESRVIDKLKN